MGRSTVYNNIVTEELWSQVSKVNKELIEDFKEYKESADKSNATIYQYINSLKIFFVWNLQKNDNKSFADVKKKDLIKFSNYLIKELKSSPKRRSFMKSTLSSLSNYIEDVLTDEDERYENFRNITKVISISTSEAVRPKTIITVEEAERCLKSMVENGEYQMACFFALASYSGARKQELLRFKTDYFKDDYIVYNELYETPEMIKTKGRGSMGKMLHRYTFVDFKYYYDLWMKERERLGIDCEYLFVIKKQTGHITATVSVANGWAKKIEEKYLFKPFYCHALRHFWTTTSIKKGIPLDLVQQLQGWSNADMVQLYNDVSLKDTMKDYFEKPKEE